MKPFPTAATTLAALGFAAPAALAYDQGDESSYLSNFDALASSSHSDLVDAPSSLVEACVGKPKLASAPVDVVVTATAADGAITSAEAQSQCDESSHCIVPSGVSLRMTSSLNVAALTVRGALEWHDEGLPDGLIAHLCAGYVLVEGTDSLFSMELNHESSEAWVYVKNNGAVPANVDGMGTRVLGTDMGGSMAIRGRGMRRTWSLLKDEFGPGDSELSLIHDVNEMGWKVGDRIGVAPTAHGSSGTSQTFKIATIPSPHTVQLSNTNAGRTYGAAFVNGHSRSPPVLKSAEVVNLSRNIVITGDDFEHVDCDPSITSNEETSSKGCKCSGTRTKCTVGLHTIHHNHGTSPAGAMVIENTRVEKCGQRGIEGKYCLHFHKAGNCPGCVFANNAIEFGHHRGVTVHGTHRSTVTNNVVYDVRGANFYVEDGNEMHNDLSYNVAICPHPLEDPIKQGCSIPGTSTPGADAPNAAFYSKAATNDWTGNRAANTYNGMLLDAGTRGAANGKVCYSDAALGRWVGNTMHGCSRFGLYTLGHGGNFPKHTDRSIATNGFNENFELCGGFDSAESINPGSTDRGYPGAFYENVDYNNVFVGHYMAGDLQHRGHSSINNNNLIYWKETKNMADGCASHFYDAFYQDGNLALPDQGSVVISKTRFGQNVHLESNHHCDVGLTGVLCMPQYILDDISWENESSNKWLSFQAGFNNDGGVFSMAPGQESDSGGFFPSGYMSVAGETYTYLLSSPGPRKCVESSPLHGDRYDNGILCNAPLRAFKIYSRGLTEATAKMLKVEVWWNDWGLAGQNGPANVEQLVGFHIIGGPDSTNPKQGYSFPIMSGLEQSYRLSLHDPADGSTSDIPLDWVIEFSDTIIGNRFGVDDQVYVSIAGRKCGSDGLISSRHDRKYLWSGDHFIETNAWGNHGACTESADMSPVDCTAIAGGNPSDEGSIEASECPELCSSSPCNSNSYCHCGMPSTCKCKPGFTGPDCSIDVCSAANCGDHGACIAQHLGGEGDVTIDSSMACVCEEGWFGDRCDVNPCTDIPNACSGNGKCVSTNGVDMQCQCFDGYLGSNCDVYNVAQGKPSLASSENWAGSAAIKAFDGNMGSRFESVHGIDDVYLQVDLGSTFLVDKVVTHWEFSAAKSYDIQLSDDGVSFATIWSKTDGSAGMGVIESVLGGASGRYVRMQAHERATVWGYSIYEMQVFGSIGPTSPPTPHPTYKFVTLAPIISASPSKFPTKAPTAKPITQAPTALSTPNMELLSQGKLASASSENWAGSAAQKAFDGDMGTRWESAHGIEDVYLQVDLGDVFLLDKVVAQWEFSAAKSYDIQVSNDGSSFTTVWSKTDGFGGMGSIESALGGVSGRFVRMQGYERATVWGYSIWELEVHGSSPCGGCGEHGTCVPTSAAGDFKCKCDTDYSGESCDVNCAGHCTGGGAVFPYGCNPNLGPEVVKYGCNQNGGCSYKQAGEDLGDSFCLFKEVVNEYVAPTSNPTLKPTLDQSTPVLVSQGKPSLASSENWSGSAALKAFDGDMGTRWESAHGIENVYLLVDLGEVFNLDKVVVHWEFACAKRYDIQVSDDGVSFSSVWSKTDGFGGMGSIESAMGGASGRYVRMQAHERATVWGYSIWELEVFGSSP